MIFSKLQSYTMVLSNSSSIQTRASFTCFIGQLDYAFSLWFINFRYGFCSSESVEKIAGKEANLIRLHTLHYANKQKTDFHILELLVLLHRLVTFARYRPNATRPMSSTRTSSPNKGLHFQSKMLQFISLTQLSEEERRLLEEVTTRRWIPGISKSENLAGTKKKEAMVWHFSNSVGSSPAKWLFATKLDLDVMDGL